ncbi:MAG: glycoside hydrolase family 127 protein [Ruminococcaceae bacterium]|nr:glycoside hydrolase family 127 protein [Oscillospiraceae bacterium]
MNCKPINIKDFTPAEGFVMRLQKLIKREVIPYQYEVLCDRAEGAEKSHVVKNFENAAKALRGEDAGDGFYGMVFQDSDAAKWLEAVAYSLALFPDKELEKQADELIALIAEAQDEDGYLNTYFTIKDKEKRWANLLEGHELYCSGHFMEAAAAYYEATGKDTLLNVMKRNAEHIYKRFITEKHEGYPGHPEVELALLKMYRATGEKRYLDLAEHFVDSRGAGGNFYKREAELRDWTVWGNNPDDRYYQQSYAPVREQRDAVGHSVRAVYLYTGMAGLAAQNGDKELFSACRTLWESITQKRMYVTGGIGSTCIGEAFTTDYDLPNDTAYAETCASCGLMFFARAMLENDLNGEYADVMERAFYNTVLAGMSLDGKRFFYVNPLEVIPGISGETATHWHVKPQRPEWFTCACCPPNVARTVSSLGTYAYGTSGDICCCHLFAAGDVDFENGVKLRCSTEFPYGFTVKYEILSGNGRLAVRIPSWSESFSAKINGTAAEYSAENGYAFFGVKSGDVLEIELDDTPKFVYCSSKISENTGCAAVTRGALVYCFEGVDNNGDVLSLSLDVNSKIEQGEFIEEPDVYSLKINGFRTSSTDGLYTTRRPEAVPETLTAIPYYLWGNRGENQMRVWINYR